MNVSKEELNALKEAIDISRGCSCGGSVAHGENTAFLLESILNRLTAKTAASTNLKTLISNWEEWAIRHRGGKKRVSKMIKDLKEALFLDAVERNI